MEFDVCVFFKWDSFFLMGLTVIFLLAQQRTILSAEMGDVIWLNQENVGFKRQKYGIFK